MLTGFVDAYTKQPEDVDFQSLYIVLCKDTSWPADFEGRIESDNNFQLPQVDEDDLSGMWEDSLIFIRLNQHNVLPVVHECSFDSGDGWYYSSINAPKGTWTYSFNAANGHNSLMRNSQGRVYKCVQEPANGTCYIGGEIANHQSRSDCEREVGSVWIPAQCTVEPKTLPEAKGAPIIAGNYTWEYMWTLDDNTIVDKVNYKWQPVSYNLYESGGVCYIDDQIDINYSTRASCEDVSGVWVFNSQAYFEQSDYGVDPAQTIREAKAMNIMLDVTLNHIDKNEVLSFRQVFVVDTPLTSTGAKASDDMITLDGMSTEVSGDVYVVENKAPVIRYEDQRESIKLILKF